MFCSLAPCLAATSPQWGVAGADQTEPFFFLRQCAWGPQEYVAIIRGVWGPDLGNMGVRVQGAGSRAAALTGTDFRVFGGWGVWELRIESLGLRV